jgi:hypothetical protein
MYQHFFCIYIKKLKLGTPVDSSDELHMLVAMLHISNIYGLCFIYFLKFVSFLFLFFLLRLHTRVMHSTDWETTLIEVHCQYIMSS